MGVHPPSPAQEAAGRDSRPGLGDPDHRNEPINKSIVSLLNEASNRVWIGTGYFAPDDVVLTALVLAANRRVDVRLLISEKNDHPWLVPVGRSYYDELLVAGVQIYEFSAGIHHAKLALADNHWAMVGSANLDYRSLRLSFELNLLFHSAARNREAPLFPSKISRTAGKSIPPNFRAAPSASNSSRPPCVPCPLAVARVRPLPGP